MNIISRKLRAAPAPIDETDVLAVLDRNCAELQERDKVLLETQINLEKTAGPAGRGDAIVDAAQAEALLSGVKFIATRERPMAQLEAVIAERKVIKRALDIGLSRQQRLRAERATKIWSDHFDQIAEVEKRRVMLALELQSANRGRERLREKIMEAGGAGFLSTDSVDLLDVGDREDEVKWAAERLIEDGICTRAEIERAKNG